MIVDDAPEMRALLATILNLEGYEIVGEASDGVEGVAAAASAHPDVVVLDGRMPKMSGLEALPGVRAAVPEAKVVFFSAEPPDVMEDKALAAGADVYVDKLQGCVGILSAFARIAPLPNLVA